MPLDINDFINGLNAQNPDQPEFIQAVAEVLHSIWPLIEANSAYQSANLLERLVEPERIVIFRVTWIDDAGKVQVNRGYRVQMNAAIGPYKGGLRFHHTVNLSVLKFLAFEQVFKNALTTLPLGGGKGGSDFDPRGKSDREVMRFCQAFMTELYRHIGPHTDVPAGDIGVGAREIGFLYGQYRKLTNRVEGVLTGKGFSYGGSLLRPEATGYGCVYFCEEMLKQRGEMLDGKLICISGSGNVALHAAEKSIELGGVVLSLSDSDGTLHIPDGLTHEMLKEVKTLKIEKRGRLSDLETMKGVKFLPNQNPWSIPAEIALPCATQNELDGEDAKALIKNGCRCVTEGANMPCTPDAVQSFQQTGILFAPGKAANAGGVATSGLEMSQNATHLSWEHFTVDQKLHAIMQSVHTSCLRHGQKPDGNIDYVQGANRAGFTKVADAMLAQGIL